MGWRRTRGESERNSCRVELRGKYHEEDQQDIGWTI